MDGGVGVSSPLGATDHNARPGLPLRQTNPAGLCNSPAFASAVYRRAPAQRMLLSLLVFYESGPTDTSLTSYIHRQTLVKTTSAPDLAYSLCFL